jgi:hypothetical protein
MYAEGTEWDEVREVAGRLYMTDPERVIIEVDSGTVLINFQESMIADGYIRTAVAAAVKAVLPADYADLKVSCV